MMEASNASIILCTLFLVAVSNFSVDVVTAFTPPLLLRSSCSPVVRRNHDGVPSPLPPSPSSTTHSTTTTSSSLRAAIDSAMVLDMESARAAFVLCFFGAIGSAAVGREVIPVTLREKKKLQDLVGQGGPATSNGTELSLLGYPEPVYEEDVVTIITNAAHNMTIAEIVAAYPVEKQVPGMLRFESLAQANANVNQVAVRAVFDAMAIGINKNSVAPRTAIAKLAQYQQEYRQNSGSLATLQSNSQVSKTIGITALAILCGLIGGADYFALFHFIHGWFPEWTGKDALPLSLLDIPKMVTLPQYFMNEIPTDIVSSASDAFPM